MTPTQTKAVYAAALYLAAKGRTVKKVEFFSSLLEAAINDRKHTKNT